MGAKATRATESPSTGRVWWNVLIILQQFDRTEIPILKKAHLWEEDPVLQRYLGKKVTVNGRLEEGRLRYKDIYVYMPLAA